MPEFIKPDWWDKAKWWQRILLVGACLVWMIGCIWYSVRLGMLP